MLKIKKLFVPALVSAWVIFCGAICPAAGEMLSIEGPPPLYTTEACDRAGVNYAYYEGEWNKLPDFDKLNPVETGIADRIDLSVRRRNEFFALKFTGYLKIATAGVCKFSLTSSDGSRLTVGSKIVVNHDGRHDPKEEMGEILLEAGVHAVTLTYFQGKLERPTKYRRDPPGQRVLSIRSRVPLAWHVEEADVRLPLTISVEEALRNMPAQVYLADLKPVRAKDLSFDPKTKEAVKRDIRPPAQKAEMIAKIKAQCNKTGQKYDPNFYKPDLKVSGSATFALKPEYKWFSFRATVYGRVPFQIFADDRKIYDRHSDGDNGANIIPLPPGVKTLRIEATAQHLLEAGFITRYPAVARATLCLPGRDPTALIPLVYNLQGKQVGCRVLWAHPGEPMSILFDSSGGERQYVVYPVDRAKQPPRLDWAPQAGLILESRYLDRSRPDVRTLEGYRKLWDEAGFVAEKRTVDRIHHGFFRFRPLAGVTPSYRSTTKGAPLALSHYTGFFHVPETMDYRFLFKIAPGGYLLFDNQVVADLSYEELKRQERSRFRQGGAKAEKTFGLQLTRGLHRVDVLHYGSGGEYYASLYWSLPGSDSLNTRLGDRFTVWEPIAEAAPGPLAHRGGPPAASFAWRYAGNEWLGEYPARDIVLYSFDASLLPEREDAVFRWRFDDGHTAEGREIEHHFFAPGTRKVELEVLDGPGGKTIARAAGDIHVHVDWWYPKGDQPGELREPIEQRQDELASVTPIEEVVSLYYWTLHNEWLEPRIAVGSALAARVDEVIEALPYTRLLELAQSLAHPLEAHHDAVRKLLEAAMDRIPAGELRWKTAAQSMADILISVKGEADKGLQLLERAEKTGPTFDMARGWRVARAKQWYPSIPEGAELAATRDLKWSDASYLSFDIEAPEGRGIWIAKDFDIPASRIGKDLVVDLSQMPANGLVWFNNKLLAARWHPPDGQIVVPAAMQQPGRKNSFLALLQPAPHPDFLTRETDRPRLDFSRAAAIGRRGHQMVDMDLYTSPSCGQKGVKYTRYEGDWQVYAKEHETLPDLETMKPIGNGTLTNLTVEEHMTSGGGHRPVRVGTKTSLNLPAGRLDAAFAVKFTAYVKLTPGVYEFVIRKTGRMFVDSKLLITNNSPYGRGVKGTVYLAGGVHFLEVVYFCGVGERELILFLPDTYVPKAALSPERVMADALLLKGEEAKARELLRKIKPDAPPIDEKERLKLSSDLRRVYRWAENDRIDADYAMGVLDQWLREHPLLRMDPEFMAARIETYSGLGDHERAFTLARQMRQMDMNDDQRRHLMLVQVKSLLKAQKIDAAREVYDELKAMAPYSSATIAAAEAIKDAVKGQ